ncbi:MAG TPA: carbohydrate kinase family protein [Candidatus Paceibacterota bacterium]|jgi:sugar/nucleoside kinase (ribokinase family)|nr:carbohydrate kinase family protein [Candidatus Paceibacterota bacterium]
MKKYDLVSVGDCTIDAFIGLQDASVHCSLNGEECQLCMSFADKIPYDSLTVVPGVGNAANVAVGASRLGFNVGFLSAVGADRNGEDVMDVYKREGVSTEYIKVNKHLPTNYHFVLNFKAERTILIKHQPFDYFDPRVLDTRMDWMYFSSIGAHSLPFHHKVAEYLKKHPNVRMGFNPGTFQFEFGVQKLAQIYKHTHALFVNREEAARILKTKKLDIPPLFAGLHKLGPKIVLITDGPKGAYASDGNSRYFMPPYPDPKPPISRTGAGDAFSTGFMSALMSGLPVHDALRWAPIESMHVVQFFGAQTGLLTKPKLLGFLKKAPRHYIPKAI